MGWSYTQKPSDIKQYFINYFKYDKDGKDQRVIDIALVNFATEAYIAVKDFNTGIVWCGVVMINHVPRATDGYTFGYKTMDDGCGPVIDNCPERILKLLSPVEQSYEHESSQKYAQEWRDRCMAKIKSRSTLSALKDGMVIKFDTPISFAGYQEDTFCLRKTGRKTRWMKAKELSDRKGQYMVVGYNNYLLNRIFKAQRPFSVIGSIHPMLESHGKNNQLFGN